MTRLAIIEKDNCNPEKCSWLCFNLCPINRMDQDCIRKDKKAVIDEKLCNGCGICVNRCPFDAIHIINLPEALKEDPVLRFSENSFELFSLPIPKENTVVGILGRNGIGKSTALRILSNEIKPNFGRLKEDVKEEEIIHHYSKTHLGGFFKKLYDNKIKIAYKPQRIELIPKLFKGSVMDLINKVDDKDKGEELLKEFNLYDIKDRDIDKLSGGELQRLAIIATYIKKADFYFFDEPASFCDVIQRIKLAKLIRELSKEASVLVVEHDLATLDYISDELQIVYGARACYGIFSQSKAVRRGINEYLDGYLQDDNIRFRDYSIRFRDRSLKGQVQEEVLLEYGNMEKNFENFNLKINKGKIRKGEVLAVMGANGLGKSTFLRILNNEIKLDKGKIEKVDIAYKEQYIKAVEGKVEEKLKEVAKDEFNSGWYKQEILEKLGMKYFLDHEISTLSGGELQKFWIAMTLSSNAKILAFDEPSAFIDVEDRLKVAEIIKNFVQHKEVCSIVVDHDIQFIDYLGDSMLVFEGIPGRKGEVYGPCDKKEGMNRVLRMLDITYRRDKTSLRPRINKPGSQLDMEQRKNNEYYY